MSQNPRTTRWLWSVGCGLGLGVVTVVCVLLLTANNRSQIEVPSAVSMSSDLGVDTTLLPSIASAVAVVEAPPKKLPYLDSLPGSIEEACGLNELPPYWVADGSLKRNADHTKAIESDECRSALETHMSTINPYRFLRSAAPWTIASPIEFVVLEDPLTFERVFADPTGDLARVQDALSRPECSLEHVENNWELKETCHAGAFLNYALINYFCFDGAVDHRHGAYYLPDDNPTPEQDRLMWKQDLKDDWVKTKCKELDPTLELTEHLNLYELVKPLREVDSHRRTIAFLVEQAARLGDEAASLTQTGISGFPPGNGYKYGRFSELFTRDEWASLRMAGTFWRTYIPQSLSEPSTKHFLSTFHFLARLNSRGADPRDEIQFDWQWVVQYLCAPAYIPRSTAEQMGVGEPVDHQSCQEVVHELRQRDFKFRPLLHVLDKFEQVALELGVYD